MPFKAGEGSHIPFTSGRLDCSRLVLILPLSSSGAYVLLTFAEWTVGPNLMKPPRSFGRRHQFWLNSPSCKSTEGGFDFDQVVGETSRVKYMNHVIATAVAKPPSLHYHGIATAAMKPLPSLHYHVIATAAFTSAPCDSHCYCNACHHFSSMAPLKKFVSEQRSKRVEGPLASSPDICITQKIIFTMIWECASLTLLLVRHIPGPVPPNGIDRLASNGLQAQYLRTVL
jgi:hypothetical protein